MRAFDQSGRAYPRLYGVSPALMIVQPRTSTGIRVHQHLSTHKYHNTRSDRDTAPMAVRKGAGAALVLAALSFGSGRSWLGGERYLLESQLLSTRAQDEKGEPDASTDAGVLPARCSSPPAVAAGRDGRPELTKSPPNSGAVRAQSADTSRRRLRPAGSSHEPALADGRAAARVEDSLRDPASPLPASDRVHEAVVEPCPPRTGRLRRACRGTAHRSGRTGSGRSAARPRRPRRCASAAGAPPRRRVRGRGVPTAQTLPAPPSAAPRRRASSAPQARISACRRGPDPQPECERAVGSDRRQ